MDEDELVPLSPDPDREPPAIRGANLSCPALQDLPRLFDAHGACYPLSRIGVRSRTDPAEGNAAGDARGEAQDSPAPNKEQRETAAQVGLK